MKMNKVFVMAAAALTLLGAQAAGAYDLKNDEQGYSYILINEDVDSFTFTSDFGSIGNSGKVGYFVYPDGLEGQALKDYIKNVAADDAQFGKNINSGLVDLGARKAGERVGFYLARNNGRVIRAWDFQEDKKNGVTYISFNKNGHGRDEQMSVEDVKASGGSAPAGQPLPGALAMLVLGGLGIGAAKLRGKKKAE